MDNTGRMSGTINKQWFLYQEKEVFQDKRQKKLIPVSYTHLTLPTILRV